MKIYLNACLTIVLSISIICCTKTQLTNSLTSPKNLIAGKQVTPYVTDCGAGYHWDFYLHKCDINCPSGYHNDSITGSCVLTNTPNLVVVSNSNNPDESAGQTHNLGMDAVMPNYSNGNLEPTEQNAFSFTKAYLFSQNYDTNTIIYANNYALQYYGPVYQETDVIALANMMYNNGSISITAKNYLIQLSNYMSSFKADSISIPTQLAYNTFANNLITNENQFSTNSLLTARDKYILFCSYSIARYSSVYAANYSNRLSYKSWFSWGTVLGGDVVGAAAGALGGAAAGVLVGGIGAGPGALAGAVGTGITSSAYEAGMQVWHHFFSK